MKKLRGVLFIIVLVVVLVVAILAVPVINMIRVNSDVTYTSMTKQKADEIAYGGFQAVVRYIIENKEAFYTEIQNAPINTVTYDLDIVYTESGVTKTVNVVVKNPTFTSNTIKNIDIEATTIFGGEKGRYEERINFNSLETITTEGYILFPEDPYYIITSGIHGDRKTEFYNFDEVERKGLLQRLSEHGVVNSLGNNYLENNLPKIGSAEHIQWFKNNANFYEVTLTGTSYFDQSDINSWISELTAKESLSNKEYRNPINVIYLNCNSNFLYAVFSGTEVLDTDDKYPVINRTLDLNIDITGLGNGKDETDLIIITNGIMQFSSGVHRFDIKGGNVYFLSNNGLNIVDSTLIHEINEHEEVAPQLTFASTTGRPFTNFINRIGNIQNTFFYYPYSNMIGYIYHDIPDSGWGKPVISGGITLGQSVFPPHLYDPKSTYQGNYSYGNQFFFESLNFNRTYYTRVPWRGKMEYFGYLIN